jgi:protein TonB
VVVIRAQDRGAVGLHGDVLVARRDEPLQCEATDLSNVVAFARPRRHAAATEFPLADMAALDRPAPSSPEFGLGRRIALLAGSLALHSALLAMFWHEPRPLASIGVEVMTVEITLGADTPAGLASVQGEQDVQAAAPAEQQTPDEAVAEKSTVATTMPQEIPVAPQETAPEAKQQDLQTALSKPTPQEQLAEPSATAPVTQPVEQPPEPKAQPPQITAVQPAPEPKRIAAPTQKKADESKAKQSAAPAPTDTASGVGRGRSDSSSNYNGIVAAHLQRHKRYPAVARAAGSQGVAKVSFSLDGGGRVTSVRLADGSGIAAIDQEAVAMVRRASPFPAPPDGQGRNFTVPVRFNLRR